jgi:hypothetical protein
MNIKSQIQRWLKFSRSHLLVWVFVPGILLGSISIALFVAWSGPVGSGEYRPSPNGRFIAHASNNSRGNWGGNRSEYIELSVEDTTTQLSIWQLKYLVSAQSDPAGIPKYGMRGLRLINWAKDSSSVSIPIQRGQQVTLPVP